MAFRIQGDRVPHVQHGDPALKPVQGWQATSPATPEVLLEILRATSHPGEPRQSADLLLSMPWPWLLLFASHGPRQPGRSS
ncbi:hypothetical protein NDU88_002279 [Pleurodeles waltl]|uniref:Uncharacterized protein n=1 Tax=Pleurodeles waltl TaxID=8319 RepID=A0AAV7RDI6_PLEWA|nr:hypothetical protein NDU88_002279 [Pleurodeles waltl]